MKHMTPHVKSEKLSTYDQIKLEGISERNIEVVINLHDAGMDIDFIMKVTELSREEVEKIIKEKKKKE